MGNCQDEITLLSKSKKLRLGHAHSWHYPAITSLLMLPDASSYQAHSGWGHAGMVISSIKYATENVRLRGGCDSKVVV